MKVNYNKRWDKNGTCYSQTITIAMDEDELIKLDSRLGDIRNELKRDQMIDGHCVEPDNIKWLDFGCNYLTITEFVVLKNVFGWDENPRVLDDRNTALIINQIEL